MLREDLKTISSAPRDLRQFGVTVGAMLVLIAGFGWSRGTAWWEYVFGVGAMLIVLGAVFPRALRLPQRLWMIGALLLGWLMTRVILIVMLYAVITPLRLIAALFGKRFLDLRFKPRDSVSTYWQRRAAQPITREHLERQF